MGQEQKTTSIRLKMEHYKFLRESASNSNRTISGQANHLFEIVWHLEEKFKEIYTEIVNELSKPDKPVPELKLRRKLSKTY